MSLKSRLFGDRGRIRNDGGRWRVPAVAPAEGREMEVLLFAGDLADVTADAICTSTNPRLSLVDGTGGAVRYRGGWEIKRACEAAIEGEVARTGHRTLAPGSVHVTTAGKLPFRGILHCVASDERHRSSAEIIRLCTANALAAAAAGGWTTIAMPVFGSGHAAFSFDEALAAMAGALRDSAARVERVVIVVGDSARLPAARGGLNRLLDRHEPGESE